MSGSAEEGAWRDRFLSAALEPGQWEDALGAMAAATGSRHGQLIGFGPDAASFNWISDVDPSLLARAEAVDLNAPDLNFRLAADRMPGRPAIVHEAHYDVARQGLRTDDYLDLCSDLDIFDGCQTRLIAGADRMIGLAVLRDRKDGRTSPEDRALFARIAGHARAAVKLQRALEHQGFALLSGAFEAMGRACWLLDGAGRVGGMTPAAEQLLSDGRLRVEDAMLTSDRSDEARAIGRAIRTVIDIAATSADPVILTGDGKEGGHGGGAGMLLEFHALPRQPWNLPFAPRAIAVARVGAPTDRHAEQLMRVFRLTPAEANIALRLANGMSRAEIAAARDTSVETLKVQLRHIYEKTGCNRESQLVRMIGLLIN